MPRKPKSPCGYPGVLNLLMIGTVRNIKA